MIGDEYPFSTLRPEGKGITQAEAKPAIVSDPHCPGLFPSILFVDEDVYEYNPYSYAFWRTRDLLGMLWRSTSMARATTWSLMCLSPLCEGMPQSGSVP